jgi:hypothetical protein
MRGVADDDLRQWFDAGDGFLVERDDAERRGEGAGGGQRQPIDRDPVRRSEQDHAANALAQVRERRIDAGRDRAGIDIAGMRRDDRLGGREADAGGRWLSICCRSRARAGRRSGIEHAGDCGRTNLRCRVGHAACSSMKVRLVVWQ